MRTSCIERNTKETQISLLLNLDGGDFLLGRTGRLAASRRRQSQRQDHRPNDIQLFHELHVLNRANLPTKAVKRNRPVGS